MSETGSEIRELYEPEKGEREVKNPMWFVEEKFEKVKVGTRALERELARSAGALSDNVGVDAKFAAEVFRQVIHRLMLVMIEAGLLSLVYQLTPAPPTAQIYPLPVPKQVT
jgi:elongation factor P hydroxylase